MFKFKGRAQSGPPLYFSLVWLVYLAFPLYSIFAEPIGKMFLNLGLLVIFVTLYLYAFRQERFRFEAVLILIVMVGIFVYIFGENFVFLAFYPSPIIGTLPNKRKIWMAIGALIVLFIGVIFFCHLYGSEYGMFNYLPAMMVMLLMPLGMRLTRRSRDLREKLVLANEEIARLSKNEERQRISRDLHDTLGHTLSLITLKSELAEKLVLKHPERAVQEIKDVQATSRAALKQVRELVSGMNAATLQDELKHARQILAAAGIEMQISGDFTEDLSSPLVDSILGLCLRETVTNVVKHSKAKVCKIASIIEDGRLKLVVSDDGVGICPCEEGEKPSDGNGLRGMRERLKLIEGQLQFEASQSAWTEVVITVPLVNKTSGQEEG